MYGSFINRLGEGSKQATGGAPIEVGMGVTFFYYTDRGAGTVKRIEYRKDGSIKAVYVTGDRVKWLPWPSGYAESYETVPDGPEIKITLRSRKKKLTWMDKGGTVVAFGVRDAYNDPSF